MYTSYFKDNEKLVDASGFTSWKTRTNVTLDEYDVLEYVEGNISVPPENSPQVVKSEYKKGEIKDKNTVIDSLRDHLLVYISSLKTSKEMYNNIVGMYEVNNLNHIMDLKFNSRNLRCARARL